MLVYPTVEGLSSVVQAAAPEDAETEVPWRKQKRHGTRRGKHKKLGVG